MKTPIILITILLFLGCKQEKSQKIETEKPENKKEIVKKKRPVALENGKFFESDGKNMLYGGEDKNQHFDISGYSLKDEQFHYGIGREKFPALLKPEFISIMEADKIWADSTRFILAHSGKEVKAYSVKDLTQHEVVNDVLIWTTNYGCLLHTS